nr:hypothetical protein HK105_006552 [Polyrhizophydium stewartii]
MNNFGTSNASFTRVCKDIVDKSLLQHKDKGVRVLTACCIAELLRVHAPTVPFGESHLQAVFELFFQVIPSVTDQKYPYFSLCYELLESLNAAKTVTLVSQFPADELVTQFFQTLFKALRPDMSSIVVVCLLDVLQQLIDDSQALPHALIELLLEQLSAAQKTASPTAYQMAAELCRASADRLQRYVCQYFSDILVEASRNVTDDTNPEQFRSAHKLILEIYTAAPDILLNVIPQLEEELKVDTLPLRQLALTSLGEMFLQSGAKLVSIYPHVWKSWCDRRKDKNVGIRTEWIKYLVWIAKDHPALLTDLEPGLQQKLMDPDERVRCEAIKAVGAIATAMPLVLSNDTFKALTMRCRDKKAPVRSDAIEVTAHLFANFYTQSQQAGNEAAPSPLRIEMFAWLAGSILELLYISDAEMGYPALVEKALYTHILPPIPDDDERTRRIVTVLHHLTERQYKAFVNLLDRKATAIQQMTLFVTHSQKFNGGVMDADEEAITTGLNNLIVYMSGSLPEPKKAQTNLHKYAEINDKRIYQLTQSIMNPHAEFRKMAAHLKELTKRLEQANKQIMDTFSVLLRRVSLALVGRTTVECLMKMLQSSRQAATAHVGDPPVNMEPTIKQLMKDVSLLFPAVYKTLVRNFVDAIVDEEQSDSGELAVADPLGALARYVKAFPHEAPQDARAVERLRELALSDVPEVAKCAMIVLAQGEHADACQSVVEPMLDVLQTILADLDVQHPGIVAHLACLQAAARYAYRSSFLANVVPIMNFIVKEVLLVNTHEPNDDDPDWLDYSELPVAGKIKIMALKLDVKPVLTIDSEDDEAPKLELAGSVIKMLRRILDSSGEIVPSGAQTSATFRTHLRLTAGLCMLKIARNGKLRALLDPMDVRRMAMLVQDPVFQVRNGFTMKLCAFLQGTLVPSHYIIMLFLIAHEPDAVLKTQVRTFVTRRAKQMRIGDSTSKAPLVENTFGSFLHLIAHHPDFSSESEDLEMAEGYIHFFFETVATAENVAMLYSVAAKVKTLKDKYADDSQKLYIAGELAQILIQDRASSNSWVLQSWQGPLPISSSIFEHLPSQEASAVRGAALRGVCGSDRADQTPRVQNLKHQYLRPEFMGERAQRTRSASASASARKRRALLDYDASDSDGASSDGSYGGGRRQPRKRKLSPTPSGARTPRSDRDESADGQGEERLRRSARKPVTASMKELSSSESDAESDADDASNSEQENVEAVARTVRRSRAARAPSPDGLRLGTAQSASKAKRDVAAKPRRGAALKRSSAASDTVSDDEGDALVASTPSKPQQQPASRRPARAAARK